MRKTWKMKPVDETQVTQLAKEMSVPPLLARLLIHRGAGTPQEASDFLCADLGSLPSPSLMAELDKGVQRIRQAAARGEKILVVGDYDVDGLTSTAILVRVLRDELKADVSWHVPDRITDGYGLKEPVIEEGIRAGVKLLITVDCGTTAFKELSLARQGGMEAVVVDHHELCLGRRPPCSAFLNPLQPGCRYPNKDLASVGVAFTLARGLLGEFQKHAWDHLDLVALGTVADLSSLVGENRILVRAGLHRLQGTLKPGLRALLSQTKLQGQRLTSEEISFLLGPRLNAMGRVGSARAALQLLITEDPEEARAIVGRMNQQNRTRAALEREAFRRALAKVEREVNFARERVIVLEDERWHPGVIGIIATRLAWRFNRPTVVIAGSGSVCRGSARSIRAFPLLEALEQVKEHLSEFGGHPGAAGLTIARDRIGPFREALNRVAHERIDPQMLTPSLEMDGELPLSSLTDELMRGLERLAPFGAGNPWPIFVSQDAQIPLAKRETPFSPWGIRFFVEDGQGRSFLVLQPRQEMEEGWNVRRIPGGPVTLVYSPMIRFGQTDKSAIELRLCDLRI